MPLLTAQVPEHFVVGIFGTQYHEVLPSETKSSLVKSFGDSIKAAAKYVDEVVHDDSERGVGLSRVWISYWSSQGDYKQWWNSGTVTRFWASLTDDAGFWREVLHFRSTRFLNEVTQNVPSGASNLGPLSPLTEKSGYWGAYRDRIEEATAQNRLVSALQSVPEPRQPDGTIRRGRVQMSQFPDNICYVIEGQDHTPLKEHEGKVWSKKFHWATKRWVTNIIRAGPEKGLLSSRLCHVPESGFMNIESPGMADDPDIYPALDINRKIEILYFLDLSYMERIGRRDKVHVKLRKDFMDAYGPGGIMAAGDLLLWVELGILKADTIEAEYIGCYEGTGFLAYDHHPSFSSTAVASSDRKLF
ncbi:hypothetical protein H2204_003561 [Knufia peltigerae]|uniref:Phenylacetaldoxime dehydratase n=1 Tax=Knufia peltigerae TaxID=1002370 RepID=A0AA38Y904_9EURO|nr:hypothetical protein H2204_003561 [Knufia peltigerae]